jgi:uroporphyrinogen-III synthase
LIRKVFISREQKDCENLSNRLLRNEIDLISKSLITFEPVPFFIPRFYDVIFFSSLRSAHFYLKDVAIDKRIQVACIGSETAKKLIEMGIRPAFIGENSGNPESVAIDFKNWLGNRTVVFPHSDQSFHSVANLLDSSQVIKVEVYKTINTPLMIPRCDLYIFSSPSNVKSFTINNKLNEESQVIAWGTSTAKELIKNKIPVMNVLQTGTLNELEIYICSYFNLK